MRQTTPNITKTENHLSSQQAVGCKSLTLAGKLSSLIYNVTREASYLAQYEHPPYTQLQRTELAALHIWLH